MIWLHLQTCLNVIFVSALYHISINSKSKLLADHYMLTPYFREYLWVFINIMYSYYWSF